MQANGGIKNGDSIGNRKGNTVKNGGLQAIIGSWGNDTILVRGLPKKKKKIATLVLV